MDKTLLMTKKCYKKTKKVLHFSKKKVLQEILEKVLQENNKKVLHFSKKKCNKKSQKVLQEMRIESLRIMTK